MSLHIFICLYCVHLSLRSHNTGHSQCHPVNQLRQAEQRNTKKQSQQSTAITAEVKCAEYLIASHRLKWFVVEGEKQPGFGGRR